MRRARCWVLPTVVMAVACNGGLIGGDSKGDSPEGFPIGTDPSNPELDAQGRPIAGSGSQSDPSQGEPGRTDSDDSFGDARDVVDSMPGATVPAEAPSRFTCEQPERGAQAGAAMRRMTRDELVGSLEAVVGATIMQQGDVRAAIAAIPEETPGDIVKEFQNGHALEHAQGVMLTAKAVATAVMADDVARETLLGACANAPEQDCAAAFLDTTATRILRRPLDATRRANMLTDFDEDGGDAAAMERLLARVLQSPEVVFHLEPSGKTAPAAAPPPSTACEQPKPLTLAWDDETVFFKPNDASVKGPQRQLSESGWYVWEIPGDRIEAGYEGLELTVLAESTDDTALQLQVNVNDTPMMEGVELPPGMHTVKTEVAIPANQDLKIGVLAKNSSENLTAELQRVVLQPQPDQCMSDGSVAAPAPAVPAESESTDPDPWTIASRVAYALTGQGPDPDLLAAAARGQLASVDEVLPHARRLLSTPAARQQFEAILDAWLGLRTIPTPNDTIAEGAGIDPEGLAAEARRELLDYVTFMVFDLDADVSKLMNAPLGFPRSERMATLYGSAVATGEQPVELSEGHGGLLLRVATLLSGQYGASPILRGVYVRKRLLCDELPSPDFTIVEARETAVEESDPSVLTTREIMARITSPDACMACHTMINPIGFALERFGPLGEPRELEVAYSSDGMVVAEHAIDTFVDMPNLEIGGPDQLEGPEDLNQALSASAKVRSCIAERLYAQMHLRPVNDADMCVLAAVEQTLREGGTVKEAWVQTVVNDELFRSRAEVSP
ncbi:MAG: DUF1588 domain-containing protein [Myxococcales bacterium]|nr:DUF1588 domain-containing protein [Myxococcales bacterium]